METLKKTIVYIRPICYNIYNKQIVKYRSARSGNVSRIKGVGMNQIITICLFLRPFLFAWKS